MGATSSPSTLPVPPVTTDPESGFPLSVIVADATDNIALGYLPGGSIIGAALGNELAE